MQKGSSLIPLLNTHTIMILTEFGIYVLINERKVPTNRKEENIQVNI